MTEPKVETISGVRISSSVHSLIAEEGQAGWESVWQKGLTLWETGAAQPPLENLVKSSRLPLPTSGRALVPGCGRAYDAIVIASALGLQTVAVDISPTAVQAAEQLVNGLPDSPSNKLSLEIRLADFFALSESETDRFDLIYDYTFFVAIPPSRRGEWGAKMGALARSGTFLITLMFPLGLPNRPQGPPFYVLPEHYEQVLGKGWEKVLDEVPAVVDEGKEGFQRLVVWRKL